MPHASILKCLLYLSVFQAESESAPHCLTSTFGAIQTPPHRKKHLVSQRWLLVNVVSREVVVTCIISSPFKPPQSSLIWISIPASFTTLAVISCFVFRETFILSVMSISGASDLLSTASLMIHKFDNKQPWWSLFESWQILQKTSAGWH